MELCEPAHDAAKLKIYTNTETKLARHREIFPADDDDITVLLINVDIIIQT